MLTPEPCRSIGPPSYEGTFRELEADEIGAIAQAFADETALQMRAEGFDAVQLHAGRRGGLWQSLSPHAGKRADAYGGSPEKRAQIIKEIVDRIRVGAEDLRVLIKANCTDTLRMGSSTMDWPRPRRRLGRPAWPDRRQWRCLGLPHSLRRGAGRPIPAAESQTGILDPKRQAYSLLSFSSSISRFPSFW